MANTSGLSKKTINQTSAEIISLSDAKMHEATGVSERNTVLKKQSESKQVKQNNLQKVYKDINGLNHYSPQIERVELNLINKIHVSNDLVNNNTSTRDCDAGYIDDCSGDGDCCPESWIGDGFADCEDQAYGCDLTCYDNDGGDCEGGTGGGDGGGSEECTDCEFDFTNYGSECCDTAWDEY
ncbi:MAG: hypothetical protein QGF57_05875, partial [Candidatus Marinimicrobia bacterium]|nr:hypothetical protein [Candidatus Neomarinimicrobiota bacterium]